MKEPWLPYLFTSCPGGAGLQVHSVSAQITREELAELEVAGRYEPPPSARPEPSDAELTQFPVRHGFLRLSTGRFGIFRSQYVGKESLSPHARFGNYVVEAFVRAEGPLPSFPALYLGSPSFRDPLAFRNSVFAEGARERPCPLADLEEGALRPRAPMSEAELRRLFVERESLLAGALAHTGAGGRFVFEELPVHRFLELVEAMQTSLPLALAHQLTAVSYTQSSSSRDAFVLQATEEPLPNYVRQEFQRQNSGVLFTEPPDGERNHFLQFIIQARQSSWENATAFYDFLRLFNHEPALPVLEAALLLWQLLRTPELPCATADYQRALAFGRERGTPPFFERMLRQFGSPDALDRFFDEPDFDRTLALFALLQGPGMEALPERWQVKLAFFCQASLAFVHSSEPERAVALARAMIADAPELAGRFVAAPDYDAWALACAGSVESSPKPSERLSESWQLLAEVLAAAGGHAWKSRAGTQDFLRAFRRCYGSAALPAARYFEGLTAPARSVAWVLFASAVAQEEEAAGRKALLAFVGPSWDALAGGEGTACFEILVSAGCEMTAVELISRTMFASEAKLFSGLQDILDLPRIPDDVRRQALEAALGFLRERASLGLLRQVVLRHEQAIGALRLGPGVMQAAAASFPLPPWTTQQKEALHDLSEFARRQGVPLPPPLDLAALLADRKAFPPKVDNVAGFRAVTREWELIEDDEVYQAYGALILATVWPLLKKPAHMASVAPALCLSRFVPFAAVVERFLAQLGSEGALTVGKMRQVIPFMDALFVKRDKLSRKLESATIEILSTGSTADLLKAEAVFDTRTVRATEMWESIMRRARARALIREERSLGRRVLRAFQRLGAKLRGKKKRK